MQSANLNVMIKAARAAGRSLAKDFREVENLQVSSKGAGDFVSRADVAAEAIIRDDMGQVMQVLQAGLSSPEHQAFVEQLQAAKKS